MAGCGGSAVRAGGGSGGYPLYNGSWPGSSSYDLYCVNFPYDRCADLPKATVQAAIGSVPMAMGLPCGQIVLSVITAPLGALGMDSMFERLLERDRSFT